MGGHPMRFVQSLLCSVSLALSGCVAFPDLPGGARVDIVDIVDNIECEIQKALLSDLPRHYWLLGWAATITLNLQTNPHKLTCFEFWNGNPSSPGARAS